jgi:hypothetical protein
MRLLILKVIFVCSTILMVGNSTAQNIKDDTILTPIICVSYAAQLPMLDMAKSFGINSSLGVNGGVKTATNWQFELDGTFMFSKNVKVSTILDPLLTENRQIVNANGEPANIEVYERGFTGTFNVGKVFPVIGPNPNSGLIAKFGVGFIRHKIRIENQDNLVPLLNPENLVYFDRLTLGVLTKQYIGYQHLGNTNLANFTFGIEFLQGFTRGMRDYQLDIEGPYKDNRLDFMFGIRVGWIIPVYRKAPSD